MVVGAAIARIRTRLEAGRLCFAGDTDQADHQERRLRLRRHQDAAVPADLVRAVPQHQIDSAGQ